MALTLQSVATFVQNLQLGIVAALSGNPPAQQITDFSDGSIAGALTKTIGRQMGWLQNLINTVSYLTRGATSFSPYVPDSNLDSFVADYGLTPPRLPATYASDQAIFSRNQAASVPVVLLVGTIIQNPTPSPSSAIQYQVIADPTNAAYSPNAGGAGIAGYTLTAGLTQFAQNPLVQAVAAGAGSNVIAGTLTVIASPSVPFDNVTNPSDITNGQNAETSPALWARFQKYIQALAKAANGAIAAAILGVQVGLTYTINDRLDANGATKNAYFTAVVDDGSGAIPAATLSLISTAVNAVRAEGIGFTVVAPGNIAITVLVNGTVIQPSFSPAAVRAAIQAAIIAYINANGVGGANVGNAYTPSLKLSYVGIANVVASFIGVGANQGLSSYASITVNGGAADVALTTYQLARATSGSVTVS